MDSRSLRPKLLTPLGQTLRQVPLTRVTNGYSFTFPMPESSYTLEYTLGGTIPPAPGISANSSLSSPADLAGVDLGMTFNESGTINDLTITSSAVPVPEPSTLLFGIVSATFAGYCGWRRRKQPAV